MIYIIFVQYLLAIINKVYWHLKTSLVRSESGFHLNIGFKALLLDSKF